VLAKLHKDGVLRDNRSGTVAENLYQIATAEEEKELASLKSIDIDQEQAEYLQTIG